MTELDVRADLSPRAIARSWLDQLDEIEAGLAPVAVRRDLHPGVGVALLACRKLSLDDDDRTRPRIVLTALRALGYVVVAALPVAETDGPDVARWTPPPQHAVPAGEGDAFTRESAAIVSSGRCRCTEDEACWDHEALEMQAEHTRSLSAVPDGDDVPARLDVAAEALTTERPYVAALLRHAAAWWREHPVSPEVRAAVAAALAQPTGE